MMLLVIAVIGCWIIGSPRSAGPDEPSHMIASAGLVRGDRGGDPLPGSNALRAYDVPGMVGAPDPACWVLAPGAEFSGRTPVACADEQPLVTDTQTKASRSADYAPFAYVLPGLASYVPWPGGYAYLARLLDAAVPVGLLIWSLALWMRRGGIASLVLLLGMTPIAWFTLAIVNPSAVAVGGGIALWTGLLVTAAGAPPTLPAGRWSAAHLAVAGWIALLLPRRDGPLWATLIVLTVCVLLMVRPGHLALTVPRRARVVAALAVPLPLITAIGDRGRVLDAVLVLSPLTLVAVDRWWVAAQRLDPRTSRLALGVFVPVAGVAAIGVAMVARPGGWEPATLRVILASTGRHLEQWVGTLGWLDTPMPTTLVVLYWAALGGLAALALVEHPPAAIAGGGAVAAAIVVAWVLELGQGTDTGAYWQGRYTMPFAVGVPLVLAYRPGAVAARTDRRGEVLAVVVGTISITGFVTAQQRWGVGVDGSWLPTRWNTWHAPVPPAILIVVHAALTIALAAAARPRHAEAPAE